MKILPHLKKDYPFFYNINTRWKDNDVYGHVNNVVYYEYFDTAVNKWLIENDLLDYKSGKRIGYIVESGCNYFSPISHPSDLEVGIRVSRIGNSSVIYEIAIFLEKNENASEGEILDYFKDKIAKWQIPDKVIFVDELPLSSTGKPLKNKLRDKYFDQFVKE